MSHTPVAFGSHPRAKRVLLYLSDTHLLAERGLLGGRWDVSAHLESVAERIRRMRPSPDATVVTGDLADLGEPDAYRSLRAVGCDWLRLVESAGELRVERAQRLEGRECVVGFSGLKDRDPCVAHQQVLDRGGTVHAVIRWVVDYMREYGGCGEG